MWPLMVCSIIGLAIIMDRAWILTWTALNFRAFMARLKNHLSSANAQELPSFVKNRPASASEVVRTYYQYLKDTPQKRDAALKREGTGHLEALGARLKMLSAIAQVAPLLGLLGTVSGLVAAFYKIQSMGGHVQPTDLAGGIWEALLTTVVGLSIGIPCLLAHQYIQAQIDKRAHQMSQTASELDEVLSHK